jgi:hypothetical protein
MRNRHIEPRSVPHSPAAVDPGSQKLMGELRQDLLAIENYEQQHGSFPEWVRMHYRSDEERP